MVVSPPNKIGQFLLPYVIVGNGMFSLKENLINIANCRISRACRLSENVFGILANRFRVYLSSMQISVENVEMVTLASSVLHNYLCKKVGIRYTPPGSFDAEDWQNGEINGGDWWNDIANGLRLFHGSNNYSSNAKQVKDEFCSYFNS